MHAVQAPYTSCESDIFPSSEVPGRTMQNQNVNVNAQKLTSISFEWQLLQQNLHFVCCIAFMKWQNATQLKFNKNQ